MPCSISSCVTPPPRCGDGCKRPREIPLIQVAYPNENKAHITPEPVTGTPGVDPCCAPNPCPGYNENPSLCQPIACTASAHDPTAPGACYDSTTLHQRSCECDKCIQERLDAMSSGKPCLQHVDGNQWQDLSRKHHDPEIQAIRDKMTDSQGIKDILRWSPVDDSLTCVLRKFRQYPVGITGQASVHYGTAQDLDYPRTLIHGVLSDEVTPGTKLISPPPLKWVDQVDLNIRESIYESNKLRPIGKSHDQTLRLPPQIDPDCTRFGKPSDKSISAGCLLNPPKTRHEVAEEGKCYRAMYKWTHGDYAPGEQVCRNYVGGLFKRTNTFGMPTPHDWAGRSAKKVMGNWRSCCPDEPYVTKYYADHLDFRLPKLGTAQDQQCIRRTLGDQFTYGKRSDQERERPIREIIFNRCPNPGAEKAAQIMQNLKNWLDRVRKSFNRDEIGIGPDFEKFYEDLIAADPNCNGTVDWDPFVCAIHTHRIPRTLGQKDFMEALAYVGIFSPSPCDKVNYYALMDLLKGYVDPLFHCKTTTLKPWYCPHTNGCDHFRTMYGDMTANMCSPQDCVQWMKEARVNGMPSIRVDKAPNKIKSTKDFTNYGDDGDAYSLIWPSVYTANCITCRDVFREMTQEEITRLLCLAKACVTHEEIDCAYKAAQALDPEGKCRVSYQTFREGLCQIREEAAKICNVHIGYPTEPCGDPVRPRRRKNPCCGVDP